MLLWLVDVCVLVWLPIWGLGTVGCYDIVLITCYGWLIISCCVLWLVFLGDFVVYLPDD